MRRDVQLYIQRDKQVVGSIGEENLITNGNFICDELITNGSFDDSSNWILGTGWSVSSGRAYRSVAASNSDMRQTITLVSGRQYRVSYEREYVSGGGTTTIYSDFITDGVNQTISSHTSTVVGVVETVTTTFTPTYSGTCLFRIFGIGDFNGYIDNIRVEAEADGWFETSGVSYTDGSAIINVNNDFQYIQQSISYTDGQKYRVSADIWCPPDEVNQFLWSDDLSQSVWVKTGVIQSVDKFKQDSTTGAKYIYQNTSVTSGQDYTVSFYVKYNGNQYVQITGSTGFSSYYVNFDLVNGTVTRNLTGLTVSIEPKEDGYYRISYTDTATSTSASGRFILALIPSATSYRVEPIVGDNSSGIFFKHAMMDQSSELRDYVATTNSAVSNTGFAGNTVRFQDHSSNIGGLLAADTTFTLVEGLQRVSYDFTANGIGNSILIERAANAVFTFNVSNVELREITDSYTTYENVKVDMFDFEDINMTDKIKDIRDISKVFTGFSQQFTLPASKTNNNLFSHFYNSDVVSGFDQRIKHKAFIKIGGADYKEGRVSLTGSSVKNGRPYSYSVVFYGKTVELKDLIGDDELKDLTGTLLDGFTFNYSSNLVNNGLSYGFDFQEYNQTLNTTTLNSDGNPDLFFPLISSENYYFYDSGNGINPKDRVDSRNLLPTATTTPRGFYYKDLKPAIKVKFIIRAIQEKYGITFSDDFFNNNNEQYEKLSMLLHREKGNIENQLDELSKIISLSELDSTSATDERGKIYLPYNSYLLESDYPESLDFLNAYRTTTSHNFTWTDMFGNEYSGTRRRDNIYTFRIRFDVAVVGSGEYTIDIYDGNNSDLKKSLTTIGNTTSFEWELPMEYYNNVGTNYTGGDGGREYFTVFYPKIKISSQGGVSEASISNLEIERVRKRTVEAQQTPWSDTPFLSYGNASYTYPDNPIQLTAANAALGVNPLTQMPKIKVLEFLTGIFKMFNLTAYYVQDDGLSEYNGQIRVRSIDSYYFDGEKVDISRYVSTDNINVNRNNLYSSIEFRYDKPKTLAITEANDRTGDEFGDELLNNLNSNIYNPLAFDGGKYNLKLPFEKVMYERMNDQLTENHILPIQWGWLANKDENPITTKPLLFYAQLEEDTDLEVDATGNNVQILLDNSVYDKNGNNTSASYTIVDRYLRPSSSIGSTRKTLHFGSEFDEWYIWEGAGSEEFGLFNTYYKRYLLQIYDRQSRIVKTSAHLPVNVMTKLNMNDVVIINGRRYRLNSLQLNLSTGKADLELMNDIAYSSFSINKPSINVVQDNGTSLFIFKGSTDEGYMESLSWNVYVDGNIHQSYAYAAQITLSVADLGAGSHDVYIAAVLDGEESQPSDTYTFTLS